MAGSDPKTSRAYGQTSARPDIDAEEDPLVELARIVSEDGAFSPKTAKPRAVARPERVERPVPVERPAPVQQNDLADGLEAELLQELENSFGAREQAPPPPPPARAPAAQVRAATAAPLPAAAQPRPAPAPAARSAAPSPQPTKKNPEELDPDELLRSIEEQLGQFERRHAARFSAMAPSSSSPAFEPEPEIIEAPEPPREEPVFGAPRGEAQYRRSSRIRPFAEIDDPEPAAEFEPFVEDIPPIPAPVRSEYRLRGQAKSERDRTPVVPDPIEEDFAALRAQELPSDYAERQADTDPFTGEAPDSLGEVEYRAETIAENEPIEVSRRDRRAATFPEFDDEPVAAAPKPDLADIEASLSRELEPEFAAPSAEDKWQDNDEPADEPKAAAVAPPPVSRRAAAVRAAEQRGRSRVGLLTAAGAIGVLVIASAAALYLRSSEEGPSGPPPVIAADDEPVRIAPAASETASNEETVGEAVYNRVAGTTSEAEEQVVESAEEPSEIARIVLPPTQSGAEETVMPVGEDPSGVPATTDEVAQTSPAPVSGGADATEPAVSGDIGPRRVPTYVVRSDGSIVETSASGPASGDATSAQSEQLANETVTIEPTPVATVTIPEAGSAPDGSLPPPTPPAPETAIDELTPRPTIDEQPAEVALAPEQPVVEAPAEATAPAEPAVSEEVAAVEPATPPPAPAAAVTDGYLVQLSAQRSMDQAQAAYAKAQQQFASVLGNLSPQIQEADLGAKGIYYRVRVGPWASRDEATGVCESLKAAGGNCFVTQ